MQPIPIDDAGLALLGVGRQQEVEQRLEPGHELVHARARRATKSATCAVEPGERPQLRHVVGVLEEAHVHQQVGVARDAVLVAERDELHVHARAARPAEISVSATRRRRSQIDRPVVSMTTSARSRTSRQLGPLALDALGHGPARPTAGAAGGSRGSG